MLLSVLVFMLLAAMVLFAFRARSWKNVVLSELKQARSDMVANKQAMVEESTNAASLSSLRFEFPVFLNGSSIDAHHARALLFVLQELKPKTILELGSGSSTIIISRALQLMKSSPDLHISVDHEERFLRNTQELASLNGLADLIRFEHCPLAALDGCELPWYSRIDQLVKERRFDLIVVDGPPAYESGKYRAREPALPQLRPYLNEGAVVILDDANRPGEREVLTSWAKQFPEFRVSISGSAKGVAVLSLKSATENQTFTYFG